jgi:hypothetical protein
VWCVLFRQQPTYCHYVVYLANPVHLHRSDKGQNLVRQIQSCLLQLTIEWKFRGLYIKPLMLTILTSSLWCYSYQKDERRTGRQFIVKPCSLSPPIPSEIKCHSITPWFLLRLISCSFLGGTCQSIDGNNRCWLWESYEICKQNLFIKYQVVYTVTAVL